HKANVLRLSDGLFLREVRAVAAEFTDVATDELIVDAAAALLLRDPQRFDVIVTTNMFGDILSDEACELSGSLGLGGSVMAGDNLCVAQAQHGSAPDIAGRNVANPTSRIVSAAAAIEQAVDAVLADPRQRTADLGGLQGTREFSALIAEGLGAAGG